MWIYIRIEYRLNIDETKKKRDNKRTESGRDNIDSASYTLDCSFNFVDDCSKMISESVQAYSSRYAGLWDISPCFSPIKSREERENEGNESTSIK